MQSWSIGNVVIVLALHRTGDIANAVFKRAWSFPAPGCCCCCCVHRWVLTGAYWTAANAQQSIVQSCRPSASARAPRLIRLDSGVILPKRICILRDRGVEIAIDEAEGELLSDTDTNNCDRNKTVSALLRCIRVSKYRISIVQYTTA